jgi:2-methylisocitrate lyase-like PEP mutase family enzyme
MLQAMGFVALASTSTGYAWSTGRSDYHMHRDDVLEHLKTLCDAVDLPVNADFEDGFAKSPEDVAKNVVLAINSGVAGLSIEDTDVDNPGKLYELPFALERVTAAKAAIEKADKDVVFVARTEILLHDPKALSKAIDKLAAFAEAGADCLYAPGARDKEGIRTMVKELAPKPVNVVMMGNWGTVQELADLGVRRISTGGALARVTWAAMIATAEKIKNGSFEDFANGTPGKHLNETFTKFSQE